MNLIFLTILASITSSFAALSIECGNFNSDQSELTEVKYRFSSTDDDFNGVLSEEVWSMAIGDKWLADSDKVIAKTSDDNSVVITAYYDMSARVGKTYHLSDIYTDNPTLIVKTKGGFAGSRVVETLDCFSSID